MEGRATAVDSRSASVSGENCIDTSADECCVFRTVTDVTLWYRALKAESSTERREKRRRLNEAAEVPIGMPRGPRIPRGPRAQSYTPAASNALELRACRSASRAAHPGKQAWPIP